MLLNIYSNLLANESFLQEFESFAPFMDLFYLCFFKVWFHFITHDAAQGTYSNRVQYMS